VYYKPKPSSKASHAAPAPHGHVNFVSSAGRSGVSWTLLLLVFASCVAAIPSNSSRTNDIAIQNPVDQGGCGHSGGHGNGGHAWRPVSPDSGSGGHTSPASLPRVPYIIVLLTSVVSTSSIHNPNPVPPVVTKCIGDKKDECVAKGESKTRQSRRTIQQRKTLFRRKRAGSSNQVEEGVGVLVFWRGRGLLRVWGLLGWLCIVFFE
jgi:hypothetical protein